MKIFNTIADLQAASLKAGQLVRVKGSGLYSVESSGAGYTLANGNKAVIEDANIPDPSDVTSGTQPTAETMAYVPAGTGAVTTDVQRKLRETVSVKDFGAVGDGVTDDTAAIQAAFDAASRVELVNGDTYLVNNLVIPNTRFWRLDGNGATIKKASSADNYYLLASKKHIDNIAEAQAECYINNVRLDGASIAEHCLIFQSWSSDVIDCIFLGATKNGVMFSAETRGGTTFPSSSLVNSRFKIISYNNGGCGFYSQDSLRNNATDGTILQGSQFYGNGDYAVFIEAGAGWDICCRTYSNGGGIGFNGHGAGTIVHDCYIDDGDGAVAALPVTGLTYSGAVYALNSLGGSSNLGLLSVSNCHISGPVSHVGTGDSPPYGVWSENNIYRDNGYIYHQYFGSDRKMFSTNDKFSEANPFRFHNGSSTGIIKFRDAYLQTKEWFISGEMDAVTDSNYTVSKSDILANNKSHSVTTTVNSKVVGVPPLHDYDAKIAKVYIFTRDFYNATPRCKYEGTVYVQSKVNGTDSWVASINNILYDAANFTVDPAVSVSDNGDGTGELTLTFTTADVNGNGVATISWVKD